MMIGRRRATLIVTISGVVLVAGALAAYLRPSNAVSVKWDKATAVRGASDVDLGRGANLYSLSCASPGNCSAVGSVAISVGHNRAIVADETNGQWANIEALKGLGARDDGNNTGLFEVSCASPGNCSAGGTYSVGRDRLLIVVADEKDGVWGKAVRVSGVEQGFAYLSTISCSSPGNCSAGGDVAEADGARAFVLDEVRGTWDEIELVAGAPGYDMVGSNISSISCSSPGSCSAVGNSGKGPQGPSPFAVNEVAGVWGQADKISGFAALGPGESDYEISLSCAGAGSCGAIGTYRAQTGVTQSFIVDEKSGYWGRAFNIPGIVALDGRHIEQLTTISCGAPGDCSAGGAFGNGSHERAFLVNETGGQWGDPLLIPGLAAWNRGHFTSIDKISCSAAGTCGAIGSYSGRQGFTQSFALNEVSGAWGDPQRIGASSFAHAVGAQAGGISCTSPSGCTVVGVVFDSMSRYSVFGQSTRPSS
jgi:hypothetical protein